MRNILLLLAFVFPLTAQEAEIKEDKKEVEKKHTRTVWSKLQDMEWKKFDAAHKRAHMRVGNQHSQCLQCTQHSKRVKMVRKHKTKQWIKTLVIGGAAYYIGYKVGQDEMKKGKRPIWMPDREKK
jgi:hypothetical protein